jgi:hypothetical protein
VHRLPPVKRHLCTYIRFILLKRHSRLPRLPRVPIFTTGKSYLLFELAGARCIIVQVRV